MSPDDGLFDNLAQHQGEPVRRQPTAAYGSCPNCSNEKVGLVRSPDGHHLIWKDHNLTTFRGTKLQCRAVGQHLCAAPAQDVIGYDTPHCPHEKRKLA